MTEDIKDRVLEIENLIEHDKLKRVLQRIGDLARDYSDNEIKNKVIQKSRRYNRVQEKKHQGTHIEWCESELNAISAELIELKDEIVEKYYEEVSKKVQENIKKNITDKIKNKNIVDKEELTDLEKEKEKFFTNKEEKNKETLIFAKNLMKSYKNNTLFKFNIENFSIKDSEIVAVVGENGNGKSTLLKILAGDIARDEGVLEYPFLNQKEDLNWAFIKENIAYIPQRLSKWKNDLITNLKFSASLREINGQQNKDEVDFILDRLTLEKYKNNSWGEISGGFQMRYELAKMMVWNPKLIILDEPLAHLDINTQQLFLQDLRDLADSVKYPLGIVISSQHIEEVEAIADKILFIRDGKDEYNGSVKDFGNDRTENIFELSCKLTLEELKEKFEELEIIKIRETKQFFIITTTLNVKYFNILKILLDSGIETKHFKDISKSTKKLFRNKNEDD